MFEHPKELSRTKRITNLHLKPSHSYSTRFLNRSYIKPKWSLLIYRISVKGEYRWNEFLTQTEKSTKFLPTFKSVKLKPLRQEKETPFFQ